MLDLACGHGRHARYVAGLGHRVEAVDRDAEAIMGLNGVARVRARSIDVEAGPWPYGAAEFDGIIVVNFLHRPLFPRMVESLAEGGVLIYETFAKGNERYGRPSNPDFLLQPGELLLLVQGKLRVVAFEEGYVSRPKPGVLQRICAAKSASAPALDA